MSSSRVTSAPERVPKASESHEKTLARLRRIQGQLKNSPRGTRMKNKVCIVSGVNSVLGIGRATALQFAHEGARHLYVFDLNTNEVPGLEKEIHDRYPDTKVTSIEGDATDEDLVRGICERAIKEEGRLDVFFANAGMANGQHIHSLESETFMDVTKINLLSCFVALKHGSQAMRQMGGGKDEAGGSIIMTASVAGIRAGAGGSDYSAAKAAVINLAQTGANQLAGTHIRVNAICPGLIQTNMTSHAFQSAEKRGTQDKIGQLNALRRYAVADEIAKACLFLASDEASYVNGVALPVDGGLSSTHPFIPGKLA